MTPEEAKNMGWYAVWALIGATVTTGLQLAGTLAGTDDILIRPLLATFIGAFFGTLATALGTSRLTRAGSTGIARQVDLLREQGVPRRDMVVLDKTEACLQSPVDQIT